MNFHIREQNKESKSITVIFHIPVPATNNLAGTPWQQAVKEHLNPVAVLSNNSVENALIENGEILEVIETVTFSSVSLINAQRLAQIETAYTTRSAALLSELTVKLNFWGYEGDV